MWTVWISPNSPIISQTRSQIPIPIYLIAHRYFKVNFKSRQHGLRTLHNPVMPAHLLLTMHNLTVSSNLYWTTIRNKDPRQLFALQCKSNKFELLKLIAALLIIFHKVVTLNSMMSSNWTIVPKKDPRQLLLYNVNQMPN